MSDQEFLTVGEFNRWAEHIDKKLDRALDRGVETERRLTTLETNQKSAGYLVTWLSGIVAALVTAVLLGLAKLRGE